MRRLNIKKMRLAVVGILAAMILGNGDARADFIFGEPVNLGSTVNSVDFDGVPCISADGLEFYFGSYREGGYGSADIWVCTRETIEDEWGPASNLGSVLNSSHADWQAAISTDGLELYFQVWELDTSGSTYVSGAIWVTRRIAKGEPWGQPEKLELMVPSGDLVGGPSLTADGLELYFFAAQLGDEPKAELYVTKRTTVEEPWGEPVRLSSIVNDGVCQVDARISSDGLLLISNDWWACSRRVGGKGNRDVWIIQRATENEDWTAPTNPGSPVNSWFIEHGVTISADGSTLYFGSSRPGGSGYVDLWQAPILPVVDFDDDGSVGMSDLLALIGALGTDEQLYDIGPMPWGDGIVDEADLEILMEHWEEFYPIIVDNFESYTDDVDPVTYEGPAIWNTWIDAYFIWNNGGLVGYVNPPFAEVDIVHTGTQAMPFSYDNDGTLFEGEDDEVTGVPYYSETQCTWDEPQNWTRRDVEVLTLWLYGEPDNSADPFYVGLEDSAGNRKHITHPDPAALTVNNWRQWRIPLTDFTGVDPTAIKIMYIGVGDPTNNQPGGSGLVRIDDIELHRSSGQ